MKIATFFMVVCTVLFSFVSVKAQNFEYFTGFNGVPAAKAKVLDLGVKNPKLIHVATRVNQKEKIFNTTVVNKGQNGKSQNWHYVFSYDADSRLKVISVTKENGSYSADVELDTEVKLFHIYNKDEIKGIKYLTELIEIPVGLIDNDMIVTTRSDISPKVVNLSLDSNSGSSIDEIVCYLTSSKNVYTDYTGKKDTSLANRFIWVFESQTSQYDPGIPDPSYRGAAWWNFSAKTGELLWANATIDVQEENTFSSLLLSPNPVTDRFVISGIQPDQQIQIYSEVGTKVYDALYSTGVDTRQLTNGVYCCKLTKNNIVSIIKFIVWK